MVNKKIQYTGKFDMLTYVFGTNSVVVLSPDCIINLLLKSSVCFPSSILDVSMFSMCCSTSVLLLLSVLMFVTEPHGGRRGVPGVLV